MLLGARQCATHVGWEYFVVLGVIFVFSLVQPARVHDVWCSDDDCVSITYDIFSVMENVLNDSASLST